MKVEWSADAGEDRREVWRYIAAENPSAAARTDAIFSAAALSLANFPHCGRPGAVPGTRELMPHDSYRLVYEVDGDTVWVLALFHTSRQWPPVDRA